MATKCNIEAVQQSTSHEVQISQSSGPSIHPRLIYNIRLFCHYNTYINDKNHNHSLVTTQNGYVQVERFNTLFVCLPRKRLLMASPSMQLIGLPLQVMLPNNLRQFANCVPEI